MPAKYRDVISALKDIKFEIQKYEIQDESLEKIMFSEEARMLFQGISDEEAERIYSLI